MPKDTTGKIEGDCNMKVTLQLDDFQRLQRLAKEARPISDELTNYEIELFGFSDAEIDRIHRRRKELCQKTPPAR